MAAPEQSAKKKKKKGVNDGSVSKKVKKPETKDNEAPDNTEMLEIRAKVVKKKKDVITEQIQGEFDLLWRIEIRFFFLLEMVHF